MSTKAYRNVSEQLKNVEFEGYPYWDNDSYDDEYGTVAVESHATMADEDIFWDYSKYTISENKIIQAYLDNHDNFMDICKDLEQTFAQSEKDNHG